MAAIAKIVTRDGGIAFSETVMKVQKRGGEATMIPLEKIRSVNVRRPREDSEGFIRIQIADGGMFRLFFDGPQYDEAVRFKRAYDGLLAGGQEPEPEPAPAERPAARRGRQAPEPREVRESRPARPARREPEPVYEEYEEEYEDYEDDDRDPVTRALLIVAVILLIAAIAGVVLLLKEAGILFAAADGLAGSLARI